MPYVAVEDGSASERQGLSAKARAARRASAAALAASLLVFACCAAAAARELLAAPGDRGHSAVQDVAGLYAAAPAATPHLSSYLTTAQAALLPEKSAGSGRDLPAGSRVVLLRASGDWAEVLVAPRSGEAGDAGWLRAPAQGWAALLAPAARRPRGARAAAPAGAHATWEEVRAKNQEVQEHLRVLQGDMRQHALDPIAASSERVGAAIAGRMARLPGLEKLRAEVSKQLRSPPKRFIDEVAGALK